MAKPTYFTCTLGQAATLRLTDQTFTNINAFIDKQALEVPESPAAGFAIPPVGGDQTQSWTHELYSFQHLRLGSVQLAQRYAQQHSARLKGSATVALLSPSTSDFMFTWLALMRLGLSVLHIAPQCQPSAIAHLWKVCKCSALIFDEQYVDLARQSEAMAGNSGESLVPIEMLPKVSIPSMNGHLAVEPPLLAKEPCPDDVAYLHHTSGTSSGLPKPINVTHKGGCGVLPCFVNGKTSASFTTTPLYHGGVADAFRAWTSGALIWFFPGKGIPITAKNIIKCLGVAHDASECGHAPPVKYFSSVPYVLQSMEADALGLRLLQKMDIVGVGGAALPEEVGQRLVDASVNLISRFGSAECGFLMSSHRDYKADKEWQYLRSDPASLQLTFEPREDGLSELVVKDGWPNMAKRNREDGSLATADLFARHPSLSNAWRYHSRADSQLTLMTGKKFDPAPVEDAISTLDLLDDVLIFGNGQAYPGALLFRSAKGGPLPDAELIERVWPAIESLNAGSQDHARLAKKMLVPMACLDIPLEKSSKGTVIRGAAEKRFADAIRNAYTSSDDGLKLSIRDEDLLETLREHIQTIAGHKEKPGYDTDLYAYGVDSVAGMRIRSSLRRLLAGHHGEVPLNIVEDCGTVRRLARYIIDARHGRSGPADSDEEEKQLMLQLVDKYSTWLETTEDEAVEGASVDCDMAEQESTGDTVVLTGATGALGAHLLALYSEQPKVRKIYCLVRGASDEVCKQRVAQALAFRGLMPLNEAKVSILRANLGHRRLDLDGKVYDCLTREATIILHAAWSVNFRMRLRSFESDNIAGVTNLLHLALCSSRLQAPRFGFCSSVASVLSGARHQAPIDEAISHDPGTATPLGYSRSKWVAEALCDRANKTTRLRGRIDVFRVGQLAGDSHNGVWNTSEAWPLMLSAVEVTGSLPDLTNVTLDWLPVDVAAKALVQGMDAKAAGGMSESHGTTRVMHVVHPGPNPTWHEMLVWLQADNRFEIVAPSAWVEALERAADEGQAEHAAFKLLDLWKSTYANASEIDSSDNSDTSGGSDQSGEGRGSAKSDPDRAATFAMDRTRQAMPVLRQVEAVDRVYVGKLWRWIRENM